MRRTTTAGIGVVSLAMGAAGGYIIAQAVDDDGPEGITETEHDRLVDACVAQTDDTPGCVEWIAETVAQANEEDLSYAE